MSKKNYQITRPFGQETRGKTAPNRLRRVDNFLLMYASNLLRKKLPPCKNVFVDLGYGEYPVTTLESAMRFRKINSELHVVGIEIDKFRVQKAQKFNNKHIEFRHGGFNLPLDNAKESASIIRAFNVLRQYKKNQVEEAYNLMLPYLIEGGLIVEGTSDPWGRIWVANLFRKHGDSLRQEAVLFSTSFHVEFHPQNFQAVLPKNYIETIVSGQEMYHFFESWKQAYQQCISLKTWGDRQVFKKSAKLLAEKGYAINICKKYISRGYLLLYKKCGKK